MTPEENREDQAHRIHVNPTLGPFYRRLTGKKASAADWRLLLLTGGHGSVTLAEGRDPEAMSPDPLAKILG